MFTGIVEETGIVYNVLWGARSAVLEIKADIIFGDLKIEDSVAVNGICLTVTEIDRQRKIWKADVMHETLRRSSLKKIQSGSRVNLERAMAANGRFGGHIVSGHIDGTGIISSIKKDDNAQIVTIETDPKIMAFIVEKGSITIDGISLTVAALGSTWFQVSVIPHTMKATILSELKPGDTVNLENDVIGKYVKRLMGICSTESSPKEDKKAENSGLTLEFLKEHGF